MSLKYKPLTKKELNKEAFVNAPLQIVILLALIYFVPKIMGAL